MAADIQDRDAGLDLLIGADREFPPLELLVGGRRPGRRVRGLGPDSLTTADFDTNERVLVPLLKSQPGYQGYVEVKAGERESISITLWASQSDAEQGLAAIRPQLTDLFGSAMDGPPERSFGEVLYVDPPK